jgi:hypothetical protein
MTMVTKVVLGQYFWTCSCVKHDVVVQYLESYWIITNVNVHMDLHLTIERVLHHTFFILSAAREDTLVVAVDLRKYSIQKAPRDIIYVLPFDGSHRFLFCKRVSACTSSSLCFSCQKIWVLLPQTERLSGYDNSSRNSREIASGGDKLMMMMHTI